MAHSPWFVARKVYLFRLPLLLLHIPRPLALPDGLGPTVGLSFIPALTNLHAWIGGTKISFFISARNQDGGLRNCAEEEYFLHCRFLSLRLLITIHYADSIIPSLASDIWNVKLKSIVKHKNQNWRKIQ